MLGLTIAASLAIGFIVAAGFVGREARKLSTQPRQPVWRLEEAAAFVEGELPFDVAAKTDPDTLRESCSEFISINFSSRLTLVKLPTPLRPSRTCTATRGHKTLKLPVRQLKRSWPPTCST